MMSKMSFQAQIIALPGPPGPPGPQGIMVNNYIGAFHSVFRYNHSLANKAQCTKHNTIILSHSFSGPSWNTWPKGTREIAV